MLGGLVVLVLPPVMIETATRGTLIATIGLPVHLTIALLAAVVLGGGLFALASVVSSAARRRAKSISIAELAGRRLRPIDPVRDLGTSSIDDPIDTIPFATPAWREAPEAEAAVAAEPEPKAEVCEAEVPAAAPRSLDLSEFAELPGRNAVWVEEPAPVAQDMPELEAELPRDTDMAPPRPVARIKPAAPPLHPSAAALARLRAVPPSELSIVQMVERFAGALHEHRTAAPGKALSAQDIAAREAALAEALRALAALSSRSAPETEAEPLQAAIARLQGMRGAA
ncbi:hypothetical protein [Porphyrobacter sp. HT-58-2]|uniref:hypothetical protein n=1 Tax=Porphyrobacter sp. HT-58-2 TaxID=2023229 RepID=UPI0011B0C298|nr:hypothetical protein [Porphyrobacter sp. HT-58-2]